MKDQIKKELQSQTYKAYRIRAKEALKGKWLHCAVVTLFLVIIPLVLNGWIYVATLLVELFFCLGITHFFLEIAKGEPAKFSNLLYGLRGKKRIIQSIVIYLVFIIPVAIGLGFLIVPGVVIALMFSQVFYIRVDNEDQGLIVVFKNSFVMTLGKKRELFCLCCTFIGWFLLGILTLGIGLLFAIPYFLVTMADFYLHISNNQGSSEPKYQEENLPETDN